MEGLGQRYIVGSDQVGGDITTAKAPVLVTLDGSVGRVIEDHRHNGQLLLNCRCQFTQVEQHPTIATESYNGLARRGNLSTERQGEATANGAEFRGVYEG